MIPLRRLRERPLAAAVTVVIALAAAAGCSRPAPAPELIVTPNASRFDQPLQVRLTGAEPGSEVVITVTATDEDGTAWTGRATYRADGDGVVDANTSSSSSGTYTEARPMGLVSSMQPPERDAAHVGVFTWPAGARAFTWVATAQGHELGRARTTRQLSAEAEREVELTHAKDGLVGTYFPVSDGRRHPAVLVIGGSEGGAPAQLAAAFAARGVPALAQAYFGEPGLPKRLSQIPLETFDRGLEWLQHQPDVDPDHVWAVGYSRGSEATLLEAGRRPDLVAGVVVAAPNSVVWPEETWGEHSAWTVGGRDVPASRYDASETAPGSPGVIPVDRIDGPVVAVCGGVDAIWSSCASGADLMKRLDARPGSPAHQLLTYPNAGHYVSLLVPYLPFSQVTYRAGSDRLEDDAARADAWPKIIDQISAASH